MTFINIILWIILIVGVVVLSLPRNTLLGMCKRAEDVHYAMKLESDPETHSVCLNCNRPRPHKKMMYSSGRRGWICDEHFGL